MIPTEWLSHRRAEDGELLGYLVPGNDGAFTPVTVFGLPVDQAMCFDDAGRRLDELGLGYLADRWLVELPEVAEPVTVQIVEASPRALTVSSIDLGDAVAYGTRFTLDVPLTCGIRQS